MNEDAYRIEDTGADGDGADKAAGTLLRLARLRADMELKEVCTGICVPSYLSKIERGKVQPDSGLLGQLFERLGIRYETDPVFLKECKRRTEEYFFRQRYGLDTSESYRNLKTDADRLSYSPLAVDWLLIVGFEEDGGRELLEKLHENLTRRQRAYFYILKSADETDPVEQVKDCSRASALLNDTFGMRCLLDAWFAAGDYNAIHYLENRFVAAALDEGNTFALGYYYHINASAYACVDMDEMMVSYYRKSEYLLMNTGWREAFLASACYNMGSVYVVLEEYEKALSYFDQIPVDEKKADRDVFLLWHKKAWAYLGLGDREQAMKYIDLIGRMERDWMEEADRLMYDEIRMRAEMVSFLEPDYLDVLEHLTDVLKKKQTFSFLYSYRKIMRAAYVARRQYRKALETELFISRINHKESLV